MRALQAVALAVVALAVACSSSSSPSDIRARAREITELPPDAVFYLNDAQGTPVALADARGAVIERRAHQGYGAARSPTEADAYGYLGRELDDSTGLAHFGARPYDPKRGLFLAPDPVTLFEPERLAPDPRRAHAYAYSAGDPINLKDDNGEWFDTVLDVASIGYDLYRISADNVFGNEDNLGENLTALGADALSAVVPFATGGGAAVRAAKHGDDIAKGAKRIGAAIDAVHGVQGVRALGTLPKLASGSGGKMFGEALGHLRNMPGDQRVSAFETFAKQIAETTRGQWSAKTLNATNARVFAGEGGEALVFDSAGSMFRGHLNDRAAFAFREGAQIEVMFGALKAL